MISNLDELIKYSENVAAKFPVIASEIRLCSPGYSDDLLAEVGNEVPYLPDSYFSVVKKIQIVGVSIGQLNLWPVPYGKKDFVASLVEANTSSDNPYLQFYKENSLVEVARLEANIVCLGRKGAQISDQVYLVDICSGPNPVLQKLANSYEQLLIVAGNLHDISMTYEDDEDAGVSKFQSRLTQLGVEVDSANIWNELLEEALY
jgi:hypothetical protein